MIDDLWLEDDKKLYDSLCQVDIAYEATLKAMLKFSSEGRNSETYLALAEAAIELLKVTTILEEKLSLNKRLRLDLVSKD